MMLLAGAAVAAAMAQPDAHSYTCRKTYAEALEHVHGQHPLHREFSKGAFETARELTEWVREASGLSADEMPLTFAYYANSDDTHVDCTEAQSLPYITSGGGEGLCKTVGYSAGVGSKGLGKYLVRVLDTACAVRGHGCKTTDASRDWADAQQLVDNLGYGGYTHLEPSLCPEGLYSPYGGCPTVAEQMIINSFPFEQHYYGLSGGGGSGGGFDIYCVSADGSEERILGGGGGGGSGLNTPEHCTGADAGGGGGGGVDIGKDEQNSTSELGAGSGGGTTGHGLGANSGSNPTHFAQNLTAAAALLRRCKSRGMHVVLRGGGGGGGGIEGYSKWDMLNCSAVPTELPNDAFGVGYGFQFVAGRGMSAKLEPNAGPKEDAYVVCPHGSGTECSSCVAQVTPTPQGETPVPTMPEDKKYWKAISKAFSCAATIAQKVCAKAKTADGQAYGEYAHYSECNCPVNKLYLQKHLPNDPAWKYVRTQRCVYPDNNADAFPEVTERVLRHHQDWIPHVQGCERLL